MPLCNNERKKAKTLTRKARKQFIYALELFGTLVTPISEYGIELGGFKGLEKLRKTNLHFCKFISGAKQSTTDNSVYGQLGRLPCQFRFRWKQVKIWNRLIGLSQCRPAKVTQRLHSLETQKIHQRKLISCLLGTANKD